MSTAATVWGHSLAGEPLLAAKLAAPRIRTPVVHRPRLTELVSRGVENLLTVVSGAAGSGKTLLLASWGATTAPPGPVAWLTLSPGDDEPGMFWAYAVAALRRAGVRLADGVGEPLPGRSVAHHILVRIADGLASHPAPVVLVLDRFDTVDDTQIHRELDFVLRHADGVLRLVLLTRDGSARWVHRYALRGELTRVLDTDLAFTRAEAADLLQQHGVRPAPGTLSALTEQTRGWAAGLRLSALAMPGREDAAAFVAALPGGEPALAGYLVDEVLDVQPADVRDVLLRTCVVDRVCPALADALTGRADGEVVLSRLESGNVLTTAVEQAPGWYRYHPLLTRVLRAELEREHPGTAGELHRRASAWFDGAGLLVDAVRHAAAAPDWPLAAALVVRGLGVGALLASPGGTQLDAALADLPPTVEGAMPAVVRAARALTAFDLDTCREQLALVEERAGEEVDADRAALLASAAVVRAVLARVDGDLPAAGSALAAGEEQLSRIPDAAAHPDLLALLLSSVGTVQLWTGRFDEAERTLRRGLVVSAAPGCRSPQVDVLGRLALLECLRGRLGRAAELGRAEVALADDSDLPVVQRTGAGHLALAMVAVEQGDQATARRHLGDATRSVGARHDPLVAALVPMLRAVRHVDGRDLRRALSSLADATAAVGGRSLPPWLADRLALTTALVHTERHDTAAAAAALDAVVSPDAGTAARRAALALADGDPGRATELLSAVPADDLVDGVGGRIEARLVAARVHLLTGSRSLARDALRRALALAEPERRRRPFLRPGPLGRGLVAAFPDVAGSRAWLGADPVGGSGGGGRGGGPPGGAGGAPFERLTDRETTVLARMAQAMSVEDIAHDLFLSVNTVKTHQRNIYRKLAVSRRNHAVRKGRDLGLV